MWEVQYGMLYEYCPVLVPGGENAPVDYSLHGVVGLQRCPVLVPYLGVRMPRLITACMVLSQVV